MQQQRGKSSEERSQRECMSLSEHVVLISTDFTFQKFVYLVTFKARLRKKVFSLTEDYLSHHIYQKIFRALKPATIWE